MGDMGDGDVVASAPTVVVRQQATATTRNRDAASSWTGPNLSAGGGRGLVAVKEALRIVAHIDMDAFYAQIEQVRGATFCILVSCKFAQVRSYRGATCRRRTELLDPKHNICIAVPMCTSFLYSTRVELYCCIGSSGFAADCCTALLSGCSIDGAASVVLSALLTICNTSRWPYTLHFTFCFRNDAPVASGIRASQQHNNTSSLSYEYIISPTR